MKKIGIMQPYFLPYIGYWQLLNAVDTFIVYDNIQYTKKGWFNRNRFLQNGQDNLFTISLKKDSDYLDVKDRHVAPEFDRSKLINQLNGAYAKAPHRREIMPILEEIIRHNSDNLFEYLFNSIKVIADHLEISTELVVSSTVPIDHSLKGEEKVLALCEAEEATTYINAVGGMELYKKPEFDAHGIDLKFIKSKPLEYKQFDNEFVPWLSIIDVMMFNDTAQVKNMLEQYELL